MDINNRGARSRVPPTSATPRLIRLLAGLAVVLVAMYFAWQKAQDRPQHPVEPPVVQVDPPARPDRAPPPADQPTPKEEVPEKKLPSVHIEPERVVQTQIKNAVIKNQDGRVVFRGTIDLTNTLERIERGERGRHANDGSVFQNREKRLPVKRSGYYREWVHPTEGLRGPGPQRVVTGDDGEIYYTPDHYQTFQRLDSESGQGRGADRKTSTEKRDARKGSQ